jgi:hypothetical protein
VRCSIVAPGPALRAFADGFVGSLAGGFVYCMILAYYGSHDLEIAVMRVLALSLTFGGFEGWRVSRQRTMKHVRKCLLWTLTASLLLFWAMGSTFSGVPTREFRQETPPDLLRVRLDPIA